MEEAFLAFISSFGYLAVLALILLENIFPPIPSELILPMAGFLVHDTSMELPGVIIFATAGSVLGAFILYGIGRLLSRKRLMAFFDTKPMRLLGFKGDDISKAIGWFDRKGQATVLICRCITFVGSAVWNTVLCSLGYAMGSAWHTVTAQAEWVSDVVKIIIIVIVLVAAIWWIVKRILPNLRHTNDHSED